MEGKVTVLERLARLDDLTASELRLARYLESAFPQAAMANLGEMSARNEVSKATVTRFARRLGFADFRDFSRALKDEITANFDLPFHREPASGEQALAENPGDLARRHFAIGGRNLRRTIEQFDDATFETVLELVSNPGRRLYLMSFASGRVLLNYFYLLATYHRGNISLLGGPDTLAHDVIDADASSVLLAAAFDSHPPPTLAVLRHFRELGCETILLTNRRGTPLLKYAKYRLFVHSEPETIFKSRGAMLVMLEALVSGMGARLQSGKSPRLKEMERLRLELSQAAGRRPG